MPCQSPREDPSAKLSALVGHQIRTHICQAIAGQPGCRTPCIAAEMQDMSGTQVHTARPYTYWHDRTNDIDPDLFLYTRTSGEKL